LDRRYENMVLAYDLQTYAFSAAYAFLLFSYRQSIQSGDWMPFIEGENIE